MKLLSLGLEALTSPFGLPYYLRFSAFKSRGAGNATQLSLARLRAEDPKFDPTKLCVLTHSSGNHAAALALQAKLAGVQAAVVMPESES